MQRCAGVQCLWAVVGSAGRRAALGRFALPIFDACAQPSALCEPMCAAQARSGVQGQHALAWTICVACCRCTHSGFELEASVGYHGLRCVWCVCGARASSRCRGLKRWGRVCAQRVAHVCRACVGAFFPLNCHKRAEWAGLMSPPIANAMCDKQFSELSQ